MHISYIDYFSSLGFNEDDYIGLGYHKKDSKFVRVVKQVKEYIQQLEKGIADDTNYYYTISSFRSTQNQRKANVKEVKELVLDIDYGVAGHNQSQFEDQQQAISYIYNSLPKATYIIHTGGGYHIHYSLKEDVQPLRFEEVTKKITSYFNVDSCSSCQHLFRLPYSFNVKTESKRLVQIIEHNQVKYSIDELQSFAPIEEIKKVSTQRAKKTVKATILKYKTSTLKRSEKLYKIIKDCYQNLPCIKETTLLAVLKKQRDLYAHYRDDRAAREDIRRIKSKCKIQAIKPILPVQEINIDNIILYDLQPMRALFDDVIFSSRLSKFDTTLSIIKKLHTDNRKAILSVPCSSGKTYSSIIYLAYLASIGKRAWLVSQKIEDVKRNNSLFQKLGISSVALHGKDLSICNFQGYIGIKNKCKNCTLKCGAQLKYCNQQYRYDVTDCSIVCTTHKHYLSTLASGKLDDIDLIVIDQNPSILDTIELSRKEILQCIQFFTRDDTQEAVQAQYSLIQAIQSRGTYLINYNMKYNLKQYQSFLYMSLASGKITQQQAQKYSTFLYFFCNKKIYGIKNSQTYIFMAKEVNLSTNISTIILDGSAKNSLNNWQNFKMYTCKDLEVSYTNTYIHCIAENPTQNSLKSQKKFDKILMQAQSIKAKENVLIFNNKDLSNKQDISNNLSKLQELLKAKDCQVVSLPRGQHIGSNEGRQCSSTLVCMSLFSTIYAYALQASVYYDIEIKEQQIFQDNFIKYHHRGFINELIQDIYIRTLERDLYQAILRGCIRDDNQSQYHVYCLVSSCDIVQSLQVDLKGSIIDLVNEDIFRYYMQGYSVSEISQLTGIQKSNVTRALNNL